MLFNYQVPVYFAVLLLSVTVWFLLHTRAGLIFARSRRKSPRRGENGLSGVVDSLRRGYLRRRIMRSCGGLFIYFLHAPVGAKHDRRTGLDSSRARGFRLLASVALGDGGVFVRFYRNYEFFAASLGSIHYAAILAMAPYLVTIAVLVIISLSLKRRGQSTGDTPQCLGQPFRSGHKNSYRRK